MAEPLDSDRSLQSRRPSSQSGDLAAERAWWSEAMTVTLQRMLAEQTEQLRDCLVEEARKQRAETAQLLAEQDAKRTPSARTPRGSPTAGTKLPEFGGEAAPRGRLEELLERETQERRAGEAGLRELIQQWRKEESETFFEAFFQPAGEPHRRSSIDVASDVASSSDGGPIPPKGSRLLLSSDPRRFSSFIGSFDIRKLRPESIREVCKIISHSRRFVVCTACVILANCVYIGFEADAMMTSADFTLPDHIAWRVGNAFFALTFGVELIIRWVAGGATFLCPSNPKWLWNWLDTLLILLAIAEELLYYLSVEGYTFGFLRLTRLLRMTRMMRAFKVVREFKELKIMVTGLLNCARPLFWAGLLLTSLTYMMAILMSQLISEYLRSIQDADLDEENMHAVKYIAEHFPNLRESMYSLGEALGGGRDWGELARPLRQINGALSFCLVLYIVVGMFCILNLLTAVFIEAAQRVDDVQELVYAKKDWVNETKKFFLDAIQELKEESLMEEPPPAPDQGSSLPQQEFARPRISRDAFIKLLGKRKNAKFLEENGVDLFFVDESQLKELFCIMDEDKDGTIDVDEFVACLHNLKGAVRSLDLKMEHQRTSQMLRSLQVRRVQPSFERAGVESDVPDMSSVYRRSL